MLRNSLDCELFRSAKIFNRLPSLLDDNDATPQTLFMRHVLYTSVIERRWARSMLVSFHIGILWSKLCLSGQQNPTEVSARLSLSQIKRVLPVEV